MPVVAAPLIGAAVSGTLTYAAGATFFGLVGIQAAMAVFATTFVLGLASNLITQAFAPDASIPSITGLDGTRSTMIRQSNTPQEVVYGTLKKGGTLVLAENTETNKYVHLVMVVAAHEVQAIDTVYINDHPVFVDDINVSTGAVESGRYDGKVWIHKHLGTDSQAVDANLEAEIASIDTNFRLRGFAYVYVKYETDRELFPQGAKLSVRIQGAKVYDPRTATTKYSTNPALLWRDYMLNTRYGRGEQSNRIDDTFVIAAANICDEFVDTLEVSHAVTALGTITNALQVSEAILKFQTGDRVEVASTGSMPTGVSAATPYYVVAYKERAVEVTDDYDAIALEFGLATSYANAEAGTVITISDAGTGSVTITKDGEPRYTAVGLFRLTAETTPAKILESILQSMAGHQIKPGQTWQVYAGAYRTPTIAYDQDDLVGSGFKVTPKQSRAERFNAVRGTYISPLNYDQPDTYPAITSSSFETADNNEQKFLNLDLPWTSRPAAAQRLAKIILGAHRRQASCSITVNATGLLSQPGDIIEFTYDRYGFSSKTFLITDWEFGSIESENPEDMPSLGVTLLLKEFDSAIYSFDPATDEELALPPNSSSLPNPFARPPAPTNLALASGTNELFVAADGTVVSRIKVTFDDTVDGFTRTYILKWKRSIDAEFQVEYIYSPNIGTVTHYLSPVEDGVAYDVEIDSINYLGVSSAVPAGITNYVVIGKTAPPDAPTEFAVARMADGTRRFTFALTNPPADVRVGGGFKLRWKLGTTSDWSAMTDLHSNLLTVSPFETNELAAGNYTFALKTIDSTGNESTTAVFTTATLGNPRLRNALLNQFEHPDWPGTATDCSIDTDSGYLVANSDGDWSDLEATWDDLQDSWGQILPNLSPIVYETLEIDLGSDVAFTPLVTVIGQGTQTITVKTGTDADGGVVGVYAAPAGQVTARYLQAKISMAHASEPIIESMTVIADGETVLEEFLDFDTSSETASWFSSVATGHFKVGSRDGALNVISSAKIIALQNVGASWTWELISKATTVNGHVAAEFKIYDNTGTLADALVDVELKGPAAS